MIHFYVAKFNKNARKSLWSTKPNFLRRLPQFPGQFAARQCSEFRATFCVIFPFCMTLNFFFTSQISQQRILAAKYVKK